jgi:hypothetical protein
MMVHAVHKLKALHESRSCSSWSYCVSYHQ